MGAGCNAEVGGGVGVNGRQVGAVGPAGSGGVLAVEVLWAAFETFVDVCVGFDGLVGA